MPRVLRFLVFVSLLGCLGQAGAQVSAPLRVGVPNNAPNLFINQQGQADGIQIALLREIASAERWTLEFVPCEWTACVDLLAEGRIDLLPDVAWSEERARVFAFHRVPAVHSWSQVYARSGSGIRALPDLKGKRIAVLSSSIQAQTLPGILAGYGAQAVLMPSASLERAFSLVADGEADAVAANHFFGDHEAARQDLVATGVVFNPSRVYYAALPGRQQAVLDAIDRHLTAWRADPNSVYFATLRQWQTDGAVRTVPSNLWWALAAAVGLLLSSLAVASWLRTEVAARTRELRENEEKLTTILDSVESLIYIKDTQSRYQYVNGAMCRMLERPAAAIVGQDDEALFGVVQARMARAG
ncbi:MAG TPA: diguanylate cyclase, partial [Massilia sp.]|nr:diguanylate cyclase [Massilia sp.]